MIFLKEAVQDIKQNPTPFFAIALAYACIELFFLKMLGPTLGSTSVGALFTSASIGFGLIAYELARIVFITGFFKMLLLNKEGQKVNIVTFKISINSLSFKRMLMLEAVVMPIMIAGLMLLFVPGIFWYVIIIFAYFLVVDSNSKIFDCITNSIELSKGYRLPILGYTAIYVIISFVGSLHSAMSLIFDTISSPLYYATLVVIYKTAKQNKEKLNEVQPNIQSTYPEI